MKHLKAFISGIILPLLFFPGIRYLLYVQGHVGDKARAIQLFALSIPLAWGVWNVIYFASEKNCPFKGKKSRPWIFGMALGFIMSAVGVFFIGVPEKLFGFTGALQYFPLVLAPFVYGFLWRYAVHFFNVLMGVE